MSNPVRLGDHVDVITGNPFKSSGYTHSRDGIRLLRGDNVVQGRIRWDDAKYWPADDTPLYERYQLRAGDVILAMDRPWIEAGLKYAELRPDDVPSLLVQRVACIRALPTLDQRFLAYQIGSLAFTAYILGVQTGTAVPHISGKQIQDYEFILPPIRDQKAIGEVLGALDDKIAVNDRTAATYEGLLRALFEELEIDVEPETSAMTVSEIVEFNPTLSTPRSDDAVYLDMAAVPTDRATVSEWSRRPPKSGTRFANGDTVMARITPCLENGKTAFIDFMKDGEIGIGSTEFIVMRSRPRVPIHLPYFLARSPRFRSYAVQNMVGSSGRQRVNASQLVDFPLRRADADDLSKFGLTARNAFVHVRSLAHESRNLAELRDTLLPKLMSGEIRVRDAEKVVEDVT